jgi:hypothetical protein
VIDTGLTAYEQRAFVAVVVDAIPGPALAALGDPLVDAFAPLEVEGRPPAPHRPRGRWLKPSADGIELFNIAKVPVTRYRYRGSKIPIPRHCPATPERRHRGEPVAGRPARRVRRAAWKRANSNPGTAPRPTQPSSPSSMGSR